ncbi:3254_t:CDS:1, partial [Scutellospora calospora]
TYYDLKPAQSDFTTVGTCNILVLHKEKNQKCGHEVKPNGETGNFIGHLSNKHRITKEIIKDGQRIESKEVNTINSMFKQVEMKMGKKNKIDQALVEFIVRNSQSFYIVKSKWFKEFIYALNNSYEILSMKYIKQKIHEGYNYSKTLLVERINKEIEF